MYYSEISKIIEAGLDRDKEKVASFAKLLAQKLEADGDKRASTRITTILERKNYSRTVTDSLVPPPVDQWIYRCAESACPMFWKSPVREEEITVPDR